MMFHIYGRRGGCGPRGLVAVWGPGGFYSVGHGRGLRGRRGFGGGDDGQGRRGRMFDSGELRLVLLKLIEAAPRHGYDLIREIEDRTGGAYAPSPGVIYPTLTLLDDMGLIEESKSEGAKKLYAITEAGRAHLAEKAEAADALLDRLDTVGRERKRADRSSLRRAMGNLGAVLANKAMAGDLDDAKVAEIVALIDEAAGKIERL